MTAEGRRHEHAGFSSTGLLDPHEVVAATGLTEGDAFLDIGCGEGQFSVAASAVVGSRGRVYAVDSYGEALTVLKRRMESERLDNIEATVADATDHIPLNDDTVDLCLMANVLHGFVANGEVEQVMREIVRVLKTGGILAVVEFKKADGGPGPPLDIRLAPEDAESLMAGYGFKKLRVVDVGPYHYAVTFVAP
jgi:ubiquinone/menaquinone biosynthesis C-methylase UbiE